MLAEITTVLVLATMLLFAASALLQKPEKSPVTQDDNPEALATRGSFVPLIIGRRKVGGLFVWIEPGSVDLDFPLGGGGTAYGKGSGGASKQPSYSEKGMHVLCVGPASKLWSIRQNGKEIFKGPITPQNTPSGTTVNLGVEGSFDMYWGEKDQPINSILQNASNHGSAFSPSWGTRYPLVCYVLWNPKELGSSPQWPRLEYEIEVPPQNVGVESEPPWIQTEYDNDEPKWTTSTPGYNANFTIGNKVEIFVLKMSAGSPGHPGINKTIKFTNIQTGVSDPNSIPTGADMTSLFKPGTILRLAGDNNTAPIDGTKEADIHPQIGPSYWFIHDAPTYNGGEILNSTGPTLYWKGINTIKISHFADPAGLVVVNNRNDTYNPGFFAIAPLEGEETEGVNLAHIIGQLMFAEFPYGANKNRGQFDFASLEELARDVGNQGEAIKGSIEVKNGEDVKSVLASVMQDAGVLISWDINLSKFVFQKIRTKTDPSSLPIILQNTIMDPLPELEKVHSPKKMDKLQFTFKDRGRNYRENTIPVGDDGQSAQAALQKPERIDIKSTTNINSATTIAHRRAQESLVKPTRVKIHASRANRLLRPGDLVQIPSITSRLLRLVDIQHHVLTGMVEIQGTLDFYGIPTFLSGPAGNSLDFPANEPLETVTTEPAAPSQFDAFEVPKPLSDGKPRVLVSSIRPNSDVFTHAIHLSRDGAEYQLSDTDSFVYTGGILIDGLSADTPTVMDDDASPYYSMPTIYEAGPDISQVEDLTSKREAWFAGRQICLIGTEICYLKNITLGAGIGPHTLKGLLRARLGTTQQTHAAGTKVYIFFSHQMKLIRDLLLVPSKQLKVKSQPHTRYGGIDLGKITEDTITIQGDAIRPQTPGALRTTNRRNTWSTGGDLSLKWCYRSTASPRTGAGNQGAGDPVGSSAVQGEFVVEFWTAGGGTKKREVVTSTPNYTYNNAQMVVDFGSEPAAIHIKLKNVEAGYKSNEITLDVTKE